MNDQPEQPDGVSLPADGVVTTPDGDLPSPVPGDELVASDAVSTWVPAQWHGRMIVDVDGHHIGRLEDVYVDVETDEPKFATVKEGFFGRHLTFVPLDGVTVGPEELRVVAHLATVKEAPDLSLHGEELSQDDESRLYHHFLQNYTPPATPSGRRLARR